MSDATWRLLFLLGAYGSLLACILDIVGQARRQGTGSARPWLLRLALFAFLFWILESYAHFATPYYYYPPIFPDMVPHFPWDAIGVKPIADPNACGPKIDHGVSASIPLVEAALTYAVMRTSYLLDPPKHLHPFLAGLVFVNVDLLLDPVLASSHDCVTEADLFGLGYWDWNVHAGLGTGWFGIPLYNYAAWFGAPMLLVALARWLDWLRLVAFPRPSDAAPPTLQDGSFRVIVLLAAAVIVFMSPRNAQNLPLQVLLSAVLLAGTLAWTLITARTFETRNPWRWELMVPQLFLLLFPFAALFGTGLATQRPQLVPIGIVTVLLGSFFAVWPYLGRLVRRAGDGEHES